MPCSAILVSLHVLYFRHGAKASHWHIQYSPDEPSSGMDALHPLLGISAFIGPIGPLWLVRPHRNEGCFTALAVTREFLYRSCNVTYHASFGTKYPVYAVIENQMPEIKFAFSAEFRTAHSILGPPFALCGCATTTQRRWRLPSFSPSAAWLGDRVEVF
jgi:hypothetical protein